MRMGIFDDDCYCNPSITEVNLDTIILKALASRRDVQLVPMGVSSTSMSSLYPTWHVYIRGNLGCIKCLILTCNTTDRISEHY